MASDKPSNKMTRRTLRLAICVTIMAIASTEAKGIFKTRPVDNILQYQFRGNLATGSKIVHIHLTYDLKFMERTGDSMKKKCHDIKDRIKQETNTGFQRYAHIKQHECQQIRQEF